MAGAELGRQAQRRRRLDQEGGAQVRPFGDVEPAQGRRQIHRCALHEARDRRFIGRRSAQIGEIGLHLFVAAASGQIREQGRQFRRRVQGGDVAVEHLLDTQEHGIGLAAAERLGGHDGLVQPFVDAMAGGLQTFRAACFDLDHGGLSNDRSGRGERCGRARA